MMHFWPEEEWLFRSFYVKMKCMAKVLRNVKLCVSAEARHECNASERKQI